MKINNIVLLASVGLITMSTQANYTSSYQEMTWDQVKKETIHKIKTAKTKQSNNLIYKLNSRIKEIESSKKTKFIINNPKEVDIWLRESYTVLEDDYVIKNAPVWKKILIKQKNVWDL